MGAKWLSLTGSEPVLRPPMVSSRNIPTQPKQRFTGKPPKCNQELLSVGTLIEKFSDLTCENLRPVWLLQKEGALRQ